MHWKWGQRSGIGTNANLDINKTANVRTLNWAWIDEVDMPTNSFKYIVYTDTMYMEYILIYGIFICIWNNLDSKNVLENIWNYIARMRGEQERTVSAFVFIYNCMKLHNQWLAYDFFDYIATFFGLLIWLLIFWVKNLTFFHIWPFC